MTAARAALTAQMTETQFQSNMLELAGRLGWVGFHHPDSRWATAAGLPDLLLLHVASGRIVLAELKKSTGKLSLEQHVFLLSAAQDERNELALWRPGDTDEVTEVLRGRQRAELRLPPTPAALTGPGAMLRVLQGAQRPTRRAGR